ncbi:MAG: hypothetical protein R6U98_34500, partial [Pirellulaceae bacterium]
SVFLLGMPETLHYERSEGAAGVATFTFPSGAVATIAFTHGASNNGGMERTTIVSDEGRHITVQNSTRVTGFNMIGDGLRDLFDVEVQR